MDLVKIIFKGSLRIKAQCFNRYDGIPSGPHDIFQSLDIVALVFQI